MNRWKAIEGFTGYEINDVGEVRSMKKPGPGSALTKSEPHLISPFLTKCGYKMVSLINDKGKRKNMVVHRLVAKAFVKNPDPNTNTVVCHKDSNCLNNFYKNLYWGTQKDNIRDEINSGHYHNNMTKELNEYGRKLAQQSHNVPRRRQVIGKNLRTGEVREFESYCDASNQLQLSRGSIRYCTNGERSHVGEWTFVRKG